jgi:putative transposase
MDGGLPDHIYTLVGIQASMSISKVVQILKSTSSKWMNDTFYPNRDFRWQSGYGGFSIGQSNLQDAVRYLNPKKSLDLFCPTGPDDCVGIIVSMTILG